MTEQEPLRVVQVEPAQDAVDPKRCTLVLRLSRPVLSYEEPALHKQLGVTVHESDKLLAYWPDQNLEVWARNPQNLSGKVMNAAGSGSQAWKQTQQRAARIDQLIAQINKGLQ
jgi:hypothetical protein